MLLSSSDFSTITINVTKKKPLVNLDVYTKQNIWYAIKKEMVVHFCWYGSTHPHALVHWWLKGIFSSMKSTEVKDTHLF